jgi:putative ABC transport system permease protein
MIASTLIVYKQMQYLQDSHLGFDQEQVLLIDIPDEEGTMAKMPALLDALRQQARFEQVALSGYNSLPGRDTDVDAFGLEKGGEMVAMPLNDISIDEHYLPLLRIPFVAGRNFKGPARQEEPYEFVVNEALVKKMGWGSAQAALGKGVNIGQSDGEYDGEIVGVVKDFHFHSFHKPIEPILMMCDAAEYPEKIMVRLPAGPISGSLTALQQQWQALIQEHPFAFSFLDASFAEQYRSEKRMVPVFTYFTGLTILIACLGLFGLVSFATQQRTKEVGIRKVMGAGPTSILYLLSREFILLVLLAVLLASPLVWYGLNRWLENFAYRIEVELPFFLWAALLALLVAALTTGYHALRGARTNPVKALRYE